MPFDVTKFIINAIITAASISYQQEQHRKMKRRMEAEAEQRKGQKFTISGTSAPLPVVYGKQMLGGIKTIHKVNSSYTAATANYDDAFSTNFDNTNQTGSKNEFLVTQLALCHDGIEGVQHILVDNIDYRGYTKEMKENNAKFQHRFHIHNEGGTADAGASANGIDNANLFTNTAYATAFYKLDRDNPQYSGSPNPQFLIKGRKVRGITRSGTSPNYTYSLNTTYEYSNNPAYCLLDYLTNSDFGRGLSSDYIDLESFYNSAQVCDTVVMTNATIAGDVNGTKPIFEYSGYAAFPSLSEMEPYEAAYLYSDESNGNLYEVTGTQGSYAYSQITQPNSANLKLYECNITLSTDAKLRDNIEAILSTMHQADLVWTPEGKYKLIADYPQSSSDVNSLINSNHVFDENDIIREEINLTWPNAQDRFTQVTVNFDNEFENFKEDSITWPLKTSSVYTTYLSEDNNNPLTNAIDPIGITNPYHAQALAENLVRKSRDMFSVEVTLSKKALTVEPGDLIKITSANANLTNEIIRVESISINADFTVKVTGYKFNHETLAWNISDNVAYSVRPDLDFSLSPPTNVQFNSSNGLLGTSSGKITWTAASDNSVREYIVETKLVSDGDDEWQQLGITSYTSFDISGFKAGNYEFSVRAKSITGRLSDRVIDDGISGAGHSIQLKTVGRVAVIYADTASISDNTQSYSVGSNEFVAYYTYDGALPTLPIRSGISFSKFVGEDGTDGLAGAAGYNSATVSLYRKTTTSTAPANPSGTFTYTFSTAVLSNGTFNNWSQGAPTLSKGEYLWIKQATAVSNTSTDSIAASEFSSATIVGIGGEDGDQGIQGNPGNNGLNSAPVFLYRKSTSNSSAPASFSGTFTYTFSTKALSGGTLNNWTTTPPSLGQDEYLWMSQATASNTGTTDSIASSEFSTPAVISGNEKGDQGLQGNPGTNGTNGTNSIPSAIVSATYTAGTNTTPSSNGQLTFRDGASTISNGKAWSEIDNFRFYYSDNGGTNHKASFDRMLNGSTVYFYKDANNWAIYTITKSLATSSYFGDNLTHVNSVGSYSSGTITFGWNPAEDNNPAISKLLVYNENLSTNSEWTSGGGAGDYAITSYQYSNYPTSGTLSSSFSDSIRYIYFYYLDKNNNDNSSYFTNLKSGDFITITSASSTGQGKLIFKVTNIAGYHSGTNTYKVSVEAVEPYLNRYFFHNDGDDIYFGFSSAQKGDTGATGASGTNGSRGAGWWRYETGNSNAVDSLNNTTLNSYLSSATGGLSPVAGDRLIVANSIDQVGAYIRNNANSAWTAQDEFIDGNLLVAGTVTSAAIQTGAINADKIESSSISTDLLEADAVTVSKLDIDGSLNLNAPSSSFIAGRTGTSDFGTDGFYIGRTSTNGTSADGFQLSHTSITPSGNPAGQGLVQGIIHDDQQGMRIYSPVFYEKTSATSSDDTVFKLDANNNIVKSTTGLNGTFSSGNTLTLAGGEVYNITLYGGGGGGSSGFGVSINGVRAASNSGSPGGTTTISFSGPSGYSGPTSGSASGGAGGVASGSSTWGYSLVGPSGQAGQGSAFGVGGSGGAGGRPNGSAGIDASNFSAGGGGGGTGVDIRTNEDWSASAGGDGGDRGDVTTITIDLTGLSSGTLTISSIGQGGQGASYYNWDGNGGAGGYGGDGIVIISSALSGYEPKTLSDIVHPYISQRSKGAITNYTTITSTGVSQAYWIVTATTSSRVFFVQGNYYTPAGFFSGGVFNYGHWRTLFYGTAASDGWAKVLSFSTTYGTPPVSSVNAVYEFSSGTTYGVTTDMSSYGAYGANLGATIGQTGRNSGQANVQFTVFGELPAGIGIVHEGIWTGAPSSNNSELQEWT